ncbi:MAG TPA: hypothetical protein VML00_05815 [Bacteroidota bacterium]|nr:hypothetical protein [Bacteroidota bacterium]
MTTKAPSAVTPAGDASLERAAYASVSAIPVAEPHDRDRLGYNVWRYLTLRRDSLEIAVRSAGARMTISEEEAVERIRAALGERGVQA